MCDLHLVAEQMRRRRSGGSQTSSSDIAKKDGCQARSPRFRLSCVKNKKQKTREKKKKKDREKWIFFTPGGHELLSSFFVYGGPTRVVTGRVDGCWFLKIAFLSLTYSPGIEHELSYSFAMLLGIYLKTLVTMMRLSTLSRPLGLTFC